MTDGRRAPVCTRAWARIFLVLIRFVPQDHNNMPEMINTPLTAARTTFVEFITIVNYDVTLGAARLTNIRVD